MKTYEGAISVEGKDRRHGRPEPESADDETERTSGPEVENLLLKGEAYKKGQSILSLLAKGLLMGGKV